MSSIGKQIAILLSGCLTFALTVAGIVVLERLTNFNFFTLSLWVVIPAGALMTGGLAASGYYFASVALHTRPNWFLPVQLILVAAMAQLAIYYAEYATFTLEDGTYASSFVSFREYLDVFLTSTHLRIGRGMHDTSAVGSFGYVLAAIEFLGFLVGGVSIYIFLQMHPFCTSCAMYLRKILKYDQRFNDQDEFGAYYANVFEHPVDTLEFAQWLNWQPHQSKSVVGTITVTTKLSGCRSCGHQLAEQEVHVLAKKGWTEILRLARKTWMPQSFDLRSVLSSENSKR